MRARSTQQRALTMFAASPGRLLAVVLLAGCASKMPPTSEEMHGQVLPDGAPPPTQWTANGAAAGDVEGGWLSTFADADLDALVAEAIAHNSDLQAAAARVEQAAGYVKAAGGTLYPSLDFFGRYGGKLGGDTSGLEGGILSSTWELDVWGRVRYSVRGVKAQYVASESDYAYARQSLAAMVAKSWFLATEATQQLQVAREMVDAATKLLDLATSRQRIGAGTELDVVTARLNLDTYRDNLRQLELSREQSLRSLELLVGRYPAAALATSPQLGALPPSVPAGLPSELLERRPDVLAAEQRVAAAFNRTFEAKAARLPRFALTASGSNLSSDLFVLKDRDNPIWSIGGSVFAPIFNAGQLKAKVEVSTAEQKEAMAHYVQTALKAFGDVENALSSEFALVEREEILTATVSDAERALRLAETRYRIGSGDLRQVEQQQLAYQSARMNLLRIQSDRRVQRVNLHLALGGDFAPSA